MGEWSELPADIVMIIEEKLFFYEDKIRFRFVCSSWRSALPTEMPHQKRNRLPWLLVPLKNKSEIGTGTSFGFLDPLDKKVHRLQLSDPQGKGMLFRGSCHGWVVNIDNKNSICLINPVTQTRVQLPPRSEFPDVLKYQPDKNGDEYCLRGNSSTMPFYTLDEAHVRYYFTPKVLLSSSPQSDQDFVAVAIYGEFKYLAYCKRGDKKWTYLDVGYSNFIFHGEQLYGVRCDGSVMVCDIYSRFPKMKEFMPKLPLRLPSSTFYLVESSLGLILVRRFATSQEKINPSDPKDPACKYKTLGFRIFKMDTSSKKWYELQSIGDDMLFLGWNSSFSLSCSNFSGYAGNHIYFTDDNVLFHREGIVGGSEVGVFSLTDCSFLRLPGYNVSDTELLVSPPPVWFTPNLSS